MKYIAKRLLQIPPVLLILTVIVFMLVYVAGDPVALMLPDDASEEQIIQLREALGLNEPFYVQFFTYILNVLTLDFGQSIYFNQSALSLVLERIPATLILAGASMLVSILIAIPLGIISAIKKGTVLDVFATGISVLGKAIPNFWLGIMLILIFSVTFQLFPVSGSGSISHLILPAITLGAAMSAEITRLIRSNLLEIFTQDYIRTARSKGIAEWKVICIHAFRNSLVPVITVTFLQASAVVGGSIITEVIFAWPGLGQLLVNAVYQKDMAIVQAAIFIIAFMIIIINLITDILYQVLDPRIRYDR